MKLLMVVLALGTVAACGPLPRPFAGHTDSNPLVEDRRVTSSVRIAPIAPYPDLDAAVVRELGRLDLLAFTDDPGARTVTVHGAIENGNLVWRLNAPDRRELGVVAQAIPSGTDVPSLARDAAPLILQLLTSDASRADNTNRAHVAVHLVHGPKGLDARALTQAMADALAGKGLLINDSNAVVAIDGEMRILPGSGGQDVLQVDWTVRNAQGASLGTVSQGSPVDRALLSGPMPGLAHDIAIAAAPGVVDVIRRKAPKVLE